MNVGEHKSACHDPTPAPGGEWGREKRRVWAQMCWAFWCGPFWGRWAPPEGRGSLTETSASVSLSVGMAQPPTAGTLYSAGFVHYPWLGLAVPGRGHHRGCLP